MKDLTPYAQAVSAAKNIPDGIVAMKCLIEQFDHKQKAGLYAQIATNARTMFRLQKWAWDLVLVGYDQKVIKVNVR